MKREQQGTKCNGATVGAKSTMLHLQLFIFYMSSFHFRFCNSLFLKTIKYNLEVVALRLVSEASLLRCFLPNYSSSFRPGCSTSS